VLPPKRGPFRLVYVSAAERFYGSMLCELWREMQKHPDLELKIVGPHGDWPEEDKQSAKDAGVTLSIMPPEKAAEVIAGADALLESADAFLVPMEFDPAMRQRMETSFPSKLIEFAQFGKPLVVWGPDYCSAAEWARLQGAALCVTNRDPVALALTLDELAATPDERDRLGKSSERAAAGEFDALAIQAAFQDLLAACSAQANTSDTKT
jgi:glycosyltransferase involved in cell wall biosynthesis